MIGGVLPWCRLAGKYDVGNAAVVIFWKQMTGPDFLRYTRAVLLWRSKDSLVCLAAGTISLGRSRSSQRNIVVEPPVVGEILIPRAKSEM